MNTVPGKTSIAAAIFACLLTFACGNVTPTLELGEAYERIYIAIFYKEAECGHRPDFPLVFLDDPSTFGVDACAFAIIRGECPFRQYPLVCVEAYNVDVPNTGPDIGSVDLQL